MVVVEVVEVAGTRTIKCSTKSQKSMHSKFMKRMLVAFQGAQRLNWEQVFYYGSHVASIGKFEAISGNPSDVDVFLL